MIVIYNGKPHKLTRMACTYSWQLTEVNAERNKFTLNHEQMVKAGFGHLVGKAA